MDYHLSTAQHDDHICAHIGATLGQTDWSIGHSADGPDVVLTFPDEITSEAVYAAVQSYTPPAPPVPPDRDADLTAALSEPSMTVAKMQAALLGWLQTQ